MYDKTFYIIGISDSRKLFLSPEVRKIIDKGKVFSGGKRHHELVKEILPEGSLWIDVTSPLDKVFEAYAPFEHIVVFASGDPLFYGFANTLRKEYPEAEMNIFPYFNSLQMLAHRLVMPYASMRMVSLTGRPWQQLDVALIENQKLIGILTDKTKTPARIAEYLLYYGYDNYRVFVGEQLGNDSEKVSEMTLKEASKINFVQPNCVILQQIKPRHRFMGIPEDEFVHLPGRKNMITKMPVRLYSLSQLDLRERKTMWDIGFCTGSVSIEAKLLFPDLEIIAFEKRKESERILEENIRKFGVPGIRGIIGDFMDMDLSELPKPDAVFIGGHGGKLKEMIMKVASFMRQGGIIVFNSVIQENCIIFREAVESCGLILSGSHPLKYDDHNPITIMKAICV